MLAAWKIIKQQKPNQTPPQQLSEFAGSGGRLTQRYVEMVPPLEELVLEQKLDPEVCWMCIVSLNFICMYVYI